MKSMLFCVALLALCSANHEQAENSHSTNVKRETFIANSNTFIARDDGSYLGGGLGGDDNAPLGRGVLGARPGRDRDEQANPTHRYPASTRTTRAASTSTTGSASTTSSASGSTGSPAVRRAGRVPRALASPNTMQQTKVLPNPAQKKR